MTARLAHAAPLVLGLLACGDALGNGSVDIDALPGEFERPLFFGMLHDTPWVSNLGNRRISWFTADGTLLFETRTTVRVPIEGGEALLVGLM